jgi:hypothetical protein
MHSTKMFNKLKKYTLIWRKGAVQDGNRAEGVNLDFMRYFHAYS